MRRSAQINEMKLQRKERKSKQKNINDWLGYVAQPAAQFIPFV